MCPIDCQGEWSDWSICSETCGGSTQTRNFLITSEEQHGGTCPLRNQKETRNCNRNQCQLIVLEVGVIGVSVLKVVEKVLKQDDS